MNIQHLTKETWFDQERREDQQTQGRDKQENGVFPIANKSNSSLPFESQSKTRIWFSAIILVRGAFKF